MARPLRIELSGGLYHITSRGDRREDIYFSDTDRETWLTLLAQVCERFNWLCHAYCLMTNHYHLVIETPEGNLAKGMRQLNGVYTQWLNRTHARIGHVFQGRYKAILVEKDSYLLELARYVVLNPVRAGMVNNVGDWQWSSYPAMIGLAPLPIWLQTDWILAQFSSHRDRARLDYQDFVRAGVGLPNVWDDLRITGSVLTFQHLSISARLNIMARPLRLEFSGALYHVTSRGDRQEDIYLCVRIARIGWRCWRLSATGSIGWFTHFAK